MTTTAKAPLSACRFRGADAIEFRLAAEEPAVEGAPARLRREWTMVAHTGKVVSRWWGRLILDLDGAKFRQRLALLKDHDTDQRLGYSTSVERTERGLEAKGKLLSSPLADQILEESRQGFPWQASLMAVPLRVQRLDVDEEAEVNGKTVTGPLQIFREWEVRELTLTALGADDETNTQAFAATGENEVQYEMTKTTTTSATEPTHLGAAQGLQPQPVPPASSQPNAEELAQRAIQAERSRVSGILAAATEEQQQLAQQCISEGLGLADAMVRLNADLRTRYEALRKGVLAGDQSLSGGNRANPTPEPSALDKAKAMPEGEAKWKALFAADQALQAEFGEEKRYVAYRKLMG